MLVEGRGAVLLQGLEAMNRAVDGDTMAVEVPEDARAPAEVMIILLLPLLLLLLLLLLLPLLLHLLLHLLQVVLEDEGFNLGDTLEAANTLLSKAVKSKEEQVVTYSSSSSSSRGGPPLLLLPSSRWRAGWWGSCRGSGASTAACCSPSPCRAPTGTSSWPQRRKYLR